MSSVACALDKIRRAEVRSAIGASSPDTQRARPCVLGSRVRPRDGPCEDALTPDRMTRWPAGQRSGIGGLLKDRLEARVSTIGANATTRRSWPVRREARRRSVATESEPPGVSRTATNAGTVTSRLVHSAARIAQRRGIHGVSVGRRSDSWARRAQSYCPTVGELPSTRVGRAPPRTRSTPARARA